MERKIILSNQVKEKMNRLSDEEKSVILKGIDSIKENPEIGNPIENDSEILKKFIEQPIWSFSPWSDIDTPKDNGIFDGFMVDLTIEDKNLKTWTIELYAVKIYEDGKPITLRTICDALHLTILKMFKLFKEKKFKEGYDALYYIDSIEDKEDEVLMKISDGIRKFEILFGGYAMEEDNERTK